MPDQQQPQRQGERQRGEKTSETRPWHGVMRAWEVVVKKAPEKGPQRR